MNHIYRIVWNSCRNAWVAVSEHGSGHARSTSNTRRARFAATALVGSLGFFGPGQTWADGSVVTANSATGSYIAPNGVTVVDIARANSAGLSHNQFLQYNVDAKGLVLNNGNSSQAGRQSQLAGWVAANKNLGSEASVILNEVVSNNRSVLAGFTEVLGGRANVVVANPYGITCTGCGFINTDRITLTTGTPNFGSDGSLAGFDVRQGDILVNGTGLNASNQLLLDMVTRNLKLDSSVNAKDLLVATGAVRWDYGTRQVTGNTTPSGAAPSYAIDTAALGGMYANSIQLIANESGVGVRMRGDAAASSGDFTLTAAGTIELRNSVSAQRDLNVRTSSNASTALSASDSALTAGRDIALEASQGGVALSGGALVASGALALTGQMLSDNASNSAQSNNNLRFAGGALNLNTSGNSSIDGTQWRGVSSVTANLGALAIGNNGAELLSDGNLTLRTQSGNMQLGKAKVGANGDLTLESAGTLRTEADAAQGLISRNGNIDLRAAQAVDNAGSVTAAAGRTRVRSNGLVNSGTMYGASQLDIADANGAASGSFSNSGTLYTGGDLRLRAASASNIANANDPSKGWVQANSASDVQLASLDNSGTWILSSSAGSGDTLTLSGALTNSGTLQSANAATVQANSVDNRGAVLGAAALTLQTDQGLVNRSNARIQSAAALSLDAGSGTLSNESGAVLKGASLRANSNGTLDNKGTLVASSGAATLRSNGLTNSGNIYGASQLDIADANGAASGSFSNSGTLYTDGDLRLRAASASNIANANDPSKGWIQANSASDVQLASLDNSGTWILSNSAGSGDTLTLSGALTNSGTLQSASNATVQAASLENKKLVWAAGNLSLALSSNPASGYGFDNSGKVYSKATLSLNSAGIHMRNQAGSLVAADRLQLENLGNVENAGNIQGGGSANSVISASGTLHNDVGGFITLATASSGRGGLVADTITNDGTIQSLGAMDLTATTRIDNNANANILANGDIRVRGGSANTLAMFYNKSRVESQGTLDVAGYSDSDNITLNIGDGAMNVGQDVTIRSNGFGIEDGGSLAAKRNLTVRSANLLIKGSRSSVLGATGGSGLADIQINNSVTNKGLVFSGNDLNFVATSVTNEITGGFSARNDAQISVVGNINNKGAIWSGHNLLLNAEGMVKNFGTLSGATGTIDADGSIAIEAQRLINNGSIRALGDVSVKAEDISNATADSTFNDAGWDWVYSSTTLLADNNAQWSRTKAYNGAQPYKPQILAGGTVRLFDFVTAINRRAVISANTVRLEGRAGAGATFVNSDVPAPTETYIDDWNHYYHWLNFFAGGQGGAGPDFAMYSAANLGNVHLSSNSGTSATPGVGVFGSNGNSSVIISNVAVTLNSVGSKQAFTVNAGRDGTISSQAPTDNTSQVNGVVGGSSNASGGSVGAASAISFGGINFTLPSNPNGRFVVSPTPNANYLIETNPRYLNAPVNSVSSDYLAQQLGYSPDTILKRLGDAGYEAYLVQQQLVAQTGKELLRGNSSTSEQMKKLMDNAAAQRGSLGLVLGMAPTEAQLNQLQSDMLWMVESTVQGQRVLVPVVYLSAKTRDSVARGVVIEADNLAMKVDSLTNKGGTISGNQTAVIVSKGDIVNLSGTIQGGDVTLVSESGSIVNKTLSSRNGNGTTIGPVASISATKDLALVASDKISVIGAQVNAGGDALLKAGNGVVFDTIEKRSTSSSQSSEKGFLRSKESSTQTTTVEQVQSGLNVGGNLAIVSDKSITLAGTNIQVGKDAVLLAKEDVQIINRTNSTETKTQTKEEGLFVGGGLWGTSTTKSTETVSQNVASNMNVGGSLVAQAGKDITLQGSKLDVAKDAALKAQNIKILAGKEGVETHTETETTSILKIVGGSGSSNSSASGSATGVAARNGASGDVGGSAQAGAQGAGGLAFLSTEKTSTDALSQKNVASALNIGGNAQMVATDKITIQGSSVDAKGSMAVAAKQLELLAGKDIETRTVRSEQTNVGLMASSNNSVAAGAGASGSTGAAGVNGSANASASANSETGIAFVDSTQSRTDSLNIRNSASSLKSGGNLSVQASDKVTLEGSTLAAGGNLALQTKTLDVRTSENISTSTTTTTNTKVGLMANSTNKAEAGAAAQAGAGALLPSASASASAGSSNTLDLLRVQTGTDSSLSTTNNKSQISAGGNMAITATDISVQGSDIAAGGNVDLKAVNMRFSAAADRKETSSTRNTTSAGLYLEASSGANAEAQANAKAGASAEIGMGYQARNVDQSTVSGSSTAVTSSIRAGGDLNRTATGKISDVGTQIAVGGSMTQSASEIESLAARDTSYSSSRTLDNSAKVGMYAGASANAGVSTGAGYDASVGGRVSVSSQTSMASENASKAVTSNITVGKNFSSQSSGSTTLEGTRIQAGGDVDIGAKTLDYKAAQNTQSSSALNVNVGAVVSVNVNAQSVVGGSVSVAADTTVGQASRSTDVAGAIVAGGNTRLKSSGDMTLKGTSIDSAGSTSIDAGGKLSILAAEDKSSSTTHNANASVTLGMSTGGKAGADGSKETGGMFEVAGGYSQSTAQSNTKTAGSIRSGQGTQLRSGADIDLEGTRIQSGGNTVLDAKGNTNLRAATSTASNVSAGVQLGVGLDRKKEDSATQTKTTTKANLSGAVDFALNESSTNEKVSISSGGSSTLRTGGNLLNESASIAGAGGSQLQVGGQTTNKAVKDSNTNVALGIKADVTLSKTTTTEKPQPADPAKGASDSAKGNDPAKGSDDAKGAPAPGDNDDAKGSDQAKGSSPAPRDDDAKGSDQAKGSGAAPRGEDDAKGADLAKGANPAPRDDDAKGSDQAKGSNPAPRGDDDAKGADMAKGSGAAPRGDDDAKGADLAKGATPAPRDDAKGADMAKGSGAAPRSDDDAKGSDQAKGSSPAPRDDAKGADMAKGSNAAPRGDDDAKGSDQAKGSSPAPRDDAKGADMAKGSNAAPRGDDDAKGSDQAKGSSPAPRDDAKGADMAKGSNAAPRGDDDAKGADLAKGSGTAPRGDDDAKGSDQAKGSSPAPRDDAKGADMAKGSNAAPRGDDDAKGSDQAKGATPAPRDDAKGADMAKGSNAAPRGEDGAKGADLAKGSTPAPRDDAKGADLAKGSGTAPRGEDDAKGADLAKGSTPAPRDDAKGADLAKGSGTAPRGDDDAKGSDQAKGANPAPRDDAKGADMAKGSGAAPRGDDEAKGSDQAKGANPAPPSDDGKAAPAGTLNRSTAGADTAKAGPEFVLPLPIPLPPSLPESAM
ncbi:hypothetical protein CHU94_03265 [Rhodoferax sp. TH121]|uniref:two-partner secretion domain-containing protein n=1 Tax=Rhodoferax sp. TH121 TaxID=2022803 RepID=UPI000B978FAC|nr:hemagglutinin repeat-containing protein [Rhodoferax sp. TH121]OYQ42033.1 hypothetical protein CHU94_03265 [Rhodoferax sp. TH121]